MNDDSEKTLLDTLIDSRELRILKTAVPYLKTEQQKQFSMIIKLIELQKTAALFHTDRKNSSGLQACAGESEYERTVKMLGAVRELCTPKEQEMIDMFLNFYEISSADFLLH